MRTNLMTDMHGGKEREGGEGMGQSSGEWLEKALAELCGKIETGLDLDADVISGLVSYCELAPPEDAAEYLNNIIGQEAGQSVIDEYLQRRGYVDSSNSISNEKTSTLRAYLKPPADERLSSVTKKQTRTPKEGATTAYRDANSQTEASGSGSVSKGNPNPSRKKKSGKVVSLAEAAKGSVVFQQGKPCSCQARRHKLVSNCLSCGKIVCEQEGEGPCSFCGALVLREGSTYAGLDNMVAPVLSDKEAAAEAFAKRLVDYDRNSAARTTVIDDQSDYYEIEGTNWLSKEEKDLLTKKQKELEEAEEKRKSKVIVTFDLVGRKVVVSEDESSELKSEYRLLRPQEEREASRIKPNPTIQVQPVFVETGSSRNPIKGKRTKPSNGLCLHISGRVRHEGSDLRQPMTSGQRAVSSSNAAWRSPSASSISQEQGDSYECSLDYN